MSQYKYKLVDGSIDETELVIQEYLQSGWEYVGFEPEEEMKLPTHLIFNWNHNYPQHHPIINYPF